MSLRIRYSDPKGVDEPAAWVSLASNARWGDVSLSMAAEVGDPATCSQGIEDPGGIYTFVGLRALEFAETSAPSNNQIIGRYAMQNRRVRRDAERALITGADRFWEIDLTDYNWHLGRRILVDADANRPAETAGDRIRWLLNHAAHVNLNDYGNVTYPSTQLDAADFRGQRPTDLLADALVEAGYNFWVDFNEAHGRPELFVMDPDSADYASDLMVSNSLDDENGSTIFAPWMDATLERSPSRIAYGAYVAYAKGSVYVRNDVVGEQYAKLDQTAPMANVKTAARATRIGNKFLADNDEESDRLVFAIKVPAAQVNDIRHGHAMYVKFTHLPGYEDFTRVRVLRRAVIQEEEGGDGYYRLVIEAVPVLNISLAPTVKWVYFAPYGNAHSEFTIQASDDGATWSTIITGAQLAAGTVNPPNVTPQTAVGLVEISEAEWRHRYWRLSHVQTHGGGYYGGISVAIVRLLSGSDWDAVDRLGTTSDEAPIPWWTNVSGGCGGSGQAACWTGDTPYAGATDAGSGLYGTLTGTCDNSPNRGSAFTGSQGCGYGVKTGVLAGGTFTSTWTFDLLA